MWLHTRITPDKYFPLYEITEGFLKREFITEIIIYKPVSPEGNQSCIFIGRTDAESDAPVFWPLVGKANPL